MEKKYCNNCGKTIPIEAQYCNYCGKKQTDSFSQSEKKDSNINNNPKKHVSMTKAFKLFWKNYVNFSGKSSRSEYWFWYLWELIITLSIGIITTLFVGFGLSFSMNAALSFTIVFIIIVSIWGLITLLPNISLQARRMKDAGLPTLAIILLLIGVYVFNIFGVITKIFFIPAFILGIAIFVITLLPSRKQ